MSNTHIPDPEVRIAVERAFEEGRLIDYAIAEIQRLSLSIANGAILLDQAQKAALHAQEECLKAQDACLKAQAGERDALDKLAENPKEGDAHEGRPVATGEGVAHLPGVHPGATSDGGCKYPGGPGRVVGRSRGEIANASTQMGLTVHEYVEGYEFRFDGGGGYTPTATERAMIEDAIHGYVGQDGTYAELRLQALQRARWTICNLVAGHSIRDLDETLVEIDAALATNPSPSSPTSRGSGLKTRQGDGANPSSGTTNNGEGDEQTSTAHRVIAESDARIEREGMAAGVEADVEPGRANPARSQGAAQEERLDSAHRLNTELTGQKLDAFQWMGDLAAFEAWYGEKMPVSFGERISVPCDKSRSAWLSVWVGSWIIRDGGECYTVTDTVYRKFIAPVVARVGRRFTGPGHLEETGYIDALGVAQHPYEPNWADRVCLKCGQFKDHAAHNSPPEEGRS